MQSRESKCSFCHKKNDSLPLLISNCKQISFCLLLAERDILNCFMLKSLTMCKQQPNLIGNNEQHPNNCIQDNLVLYYWAVEDWPHMNSTFSLSRVLRHVALISLFFLLPDFLQLILLGALLQPLL